MNFANPFLPHAQTPQVSSRRYSREKTLNDGNIGVSAMSNHGQSPESRGELAVNELFALPTRHSHSPLATRGESRA